MTKYLKLKLVLGYKRETSDNDFLKHWKSRTRRYCKPCWELHYCPYGNLVEDLPLIPPSLEEAENHQEYLKSVLKSGFLGDGKKLDDVNKELFQMMIHDFSPEEFPKEIPAVIKSSECKFFGHICPVFYTGTSVSESGRRRRTGSNIPTPMIMRIARRDNYRCQLCGRPLRDDEIELDHIIPRSKGGSSEESNLQLSCKTCNRKKGNQVK